MDDYRVGLYRPGGEHAILELFRAALGEGRSLALWRWRYGELPGATNNILPVWGEQGKLYGHYAGLPFTVVYRGREIPGALRLDFMVHPDRQRMGIGLFLIDEMRRHMKDRFSLPTGFPNPKSTGPTIKKGPHYLGEAPLYWRLEDIQALFRWLGWKPLPSFLARCANAVMRAFYRLAAMTAPVGKRYGHEEARGFAAVITKGEEYQRDGCGLYFKRDADFLRWRFDRHPEMDYTILFLSPRERSDGTAGYIVLAVAEYGGSGSGSSWTSWSIPSPCARRGVSSPGPPGGSRTVEWRRSAA